MRRELRTDAAAQKKINDFILVIERLEGEVEDEEHAHHTERPKLNMISCFRWVPKYEMISCFSLSLSTYREATSSFCPEVQNCQNTHYLPGPLHSHIFPFLCKIMSRKMIEECAMKILFETTTLLQLLPSILNPPPDQHPKCPQTKIAQKLYVRSAEERMLYDL